MEIQKQKFQKIFGNVTKKKQIHESVLLVENSDGDVSYRFEYGGKNVDTPFLIASITKLFVTTCIFILKEQGKLSLNHEITRYLNKDTYNNLHVYKGREYSHRLTISNLLFHKLIRSLGASGGCVSTARELMVFIKAFFKGKLFNSAFFHEQKVNNRLQASMLPIHYGAGYMRVPLNGFATLFMGKGELMGHSGSTGSLAFYYPEKDMFFIGDVNQMENPAIPIRLVMQLAMSMKS